MKTKFFYLLVFATFVSAAILSQNTRFTGNESSVDSNSENIKQQLKGNNSTNINQLKLKGLENNSSRQPSLKQASQNTDYYTSTPKRERKNKQNKRKVNKQPLKDKQTAPITKTDNNIHTKDTIKINETPNLSQENITDRKEQITYLNNITGKESSDFFISEPTYKFIETTPLNNTNNWHLPSDNYKDMIKKQQLLPSKSAKEKTKKIKEEIAALYTSKKSVIDKVLSPVVSKKKLDSRTFCDIQTDIYTVMKAKYDFAKHYGDSTADVDIAVDLLDKINKQLEKNSN
jgi:hypothetical protein